MINNLPKWTAADPAGFPEFYHLWGAGIIPILYNLFLKIEVEEKHFSIHAVSPVLS